MILLPAWLLLFTGIIVLSIAALGIIRLPDALSRQHAATKASALGLGFFILGLAWFAGFSGWGNDWLLRLLVLMVLLMITLPLASHALARSAMAETPETDKSS